MTRRTSWHCSHQGLIVKLPKTQESRLVKKDEETLFLRGSCGIELDGLVSTPGFRRSPAQRISPANHTYHVRRFGNSTKQSPKGLAFIFTLQPTVNNEHIEVIILFNFYDADLFVYCVR